MKLDHVGYVTNDPELFESFWVKIIGFKKVWESELTDDLADTLFNTEGAKCLRYKKEEMTLEVHVPKQLTDDCGQPFFKSGINHICLFVEDREAFLKQYPFTIHRYHNPGGWDNIFIRDFENNWIELRTKL